MVLEPSEDTAGELWLPSLSLPEPASRTDPVSSLSVPSGSGAAVFITFASSLFCSARVSDSCVNVPCHRCVTCVARIPATPAATKASYLQQTVVANASA